VLKLHALGPFFNVAPAFRRASAGSPDACLTDASLNPDANLKADATSGLQSLRLFSGGRRSRNSVVATVRCVDKKLRFIDQVACSILRVGLA